MGETKAAVQHTHTHTHTHTQTLTQESALSSQHEAGLLRSALWEEQQRSQQLQSAGGQMAEQLSGISSALGALTADHKQVRCVSDGVKVRWSVILTDGTAAVRHFLSARSTVSRPQAGALRFRGIKVRWSVMETDGTAAVRHFLSARSTDSRP